METKIEYKKEKIDFNNEDLDSMLTKVLIKSDMEIKRPTPYLMIKQDGEPISICTAGNISLITGKAKSRKSFLSSLIVGTMYVKSEETILCGNLPENKTATLFFDTEQGNFHASNTLRCIQRIAGDRCLDLVKYYTLRQFSFELRLLLIERAIESTPNLGLVVIDGLRDLVTAINDEGQATLITNLLMKWSAEKGIHVLGVLHENKGDSNARGHIGTELINKAETVISVSMKSSTDTYSKVEARYTRDKSFSPFYFTINDNGVPVLIKKPIEKIKNKQKKPEDYSAEFYREVLKKIFLEKKQYNMTSLYPLLQKEFKLLGIEYGNTLMQETIKGYLTEDLKLLAKNDKRLFSYLG